jgi:hypothetical protein
LSAVPERRDLGLHTLALWLEEELERGAVVLALE